MKNIFKNLTAEELEKANQWLKRLNCYDSRNISHVISTIDNWINGEYCKLEGWEKEFAVRGIKSDLESTIYFSIFAFGSTVTGKPSPGDIDLMIVTNHWINHYQQPLISDLFKAFQTNYNVGLDDKCSERYDRETECRIMMHVDPEVPGFVKDVDIVYQYDIVSEQRWLAHDKDPLLVISRFGRAQEPFALKRNPQPEVYRLNEAKKSWFGLIL